LLTTTAYFGNLVSIVSCFGLLIETGFLFTDPLTAFTAFLGLIESYPFGEVG
jgi:hypothetical protein